MSGFADIHIHLLYGVDDGARDAGQMRRMFDAACRDGTELFCFTPHFHPGFFGDNRDRSETAFAELKAYAVQTAPDAVLTIGNELRYGPQAISWLDQGLCRTLNGTRNVLVDFTETERQETIIDAVRRLLNAGYVPIVAHAERYLSFCRDVPGLLRLKEYGALLQIDADSIFGGWGRAARQQARRLLKERAADLVCSDAHDLQQRTPILSAAYDYTCKKNGDAYARAVFCTNARELLLGTDPEAPQRVPDT